MENTGLDQLQKGGGLWGKVWDDLFGPSAKKIGMALGTVTGFAVHSLRKYQYYHELDEAIFVKNLRDFKEGLEKIPEESICNVPTEISIPILSKFEYVSNEELSALFRNLLLNASDVRKVRHAHPGFISVIERISPDEAVILRNVSEDPFLLYMSYSVKSKDPMIRNKMTMTGMRLTGLEIGLADELNFPENIQLYLENLISLGFFKDVPGQYLTEEEDIIKYAKIQSQYLAYTQGFTEFIQKTKSKDFDQPNWVKSHLEVTNYARSFFSAVSIIEIP